MPCGISAIEKWCAESPASFTISGAGRRNGTLNSAIGCAACQVQGTSPAECAGLLTPRGACCNLSTSQFGAHLIQSG